MSLIHDDIQYLTAEFIYSTKIAQRKLESSKMMSFMFRMIIRIILIETSSKFWAFTFYILMSTNDMKGSWVVCDIKSNHIIEM